VIASLLTLGFMSGANAPIQEFMWASYYGRDHIGSVRGIGMPVPVIFSAGGPLMAARLFDTTGSYEVAFVLFAASSLIGAMALFYARPPVWPPSPGSRKAAPAVDLPDLPTPQSHSPSAGETADPTPPRSVAGTSHGRGMERDASPTPTPTP